MWEEAAIHHSHCAQQTLCYGSTCTCIFRPTSCKGTRWSHRCDHLVYSMCTCIYLLRVWCSLCIILIETSTWIPKKLHFSSALCFWQNMKNRYLALTWTLNGSIDFSSYRSIHGHTGHTTGTIYYCKSCKHSKWCIGPTTLRSCSCTKYPTHTWQCFYYWENRQMKSSSDKWNR